MKLFLAFLRLIRWPNLLIVFFTQALIWYCAIRQSNPKEILFLSFPNFLLLSLTTILIAAAGYLINDYFDIDIDRINKPDKLIIGNHISKKAAVLFYVLLNIFALAFSIYLAESLQEPALAFIQMFCILLLWAYAIRLKRTYLLGNIAVSILTALTILILVAYEPVLYSFLKIKGIQIKNSVLIINPLKLIFLYTYFAFMVTWMREIVKDVQDMEGDKMGGCRTLPILKGEKGANNWLLGIFFLVIAPLLAVSVELFHGKWIILSVYIGVGLVLPLCSIIFTLKQQPSNESYARLSSRLKMIMLLGMVPLVIYYIMSFR